MRCCHPCHEYRELALGLPRLFGSPWSRLLALCGPSPSCLLSRVLPSAVRVRDDRLGIVTDNIASRTHRRRIGGERPATRQQQPTRSDTRRQGQRRYRSIAAGQEMAMLAFTRQKSQVRSLSRPPAQTLPGPAPAGRLPEDLPEDHRLDVVDPWSAWLDQTRCRAGQGGSCAPRLVCSSPR